MGLSILRLIKAVGKATTTVVIAALLATIAVSVVEVLMEVPLFIPGLLIVSSFCALVTILY